MRGWLNQLRDYLERWWAHLGKLRPIWTAIAVPVSIALVMGLVSWALSLNTEQYLRYTGGLLELAGVCTVAMGLKDTRTLFERPSFRKAARDWFGTIPRWRQHHRLIAGSGKLTMQPGAVTGYGSVSAPANAPIDQRIAALESEVKNLSGRIQATRDEFDSKITEQRNALATEQQERREQIEGTRRLIDEAVAGGLALEAIGLLWLVIGLALSTFSPDLG